MSFKDEVDIDRYQLDTELVQQPQKYYDWGVKAARASEEKETAKHDLDIVKADIEKRIRRNPHKYDIDNPTESAIKLEIPRHPKVKRYTRKYIKACYNERVMNEAKTSFAQRKNMLQNLTQLNLQLHFAEVYIPEDVKETYYKSKKRLIQRGLGVKKSKKRRTIKRR
jgi:hypothetical protein